MLARLGSWSFEHRWRAVGAWIAVLGVTFAILFAIGPAFDGAFEIPDSESRRGFDALDEHFGGFGSGLSGSIVFRSDDGVDDPGVRSAMEAMFEKVAAIEGVSVASPYDGPAADSRVSADRTVAYAALNLSPEIDFTESAEIGGQIVDLEPDLPGLQVEVGGDALAQFEPPESEFIGLAFAVVVLIIAFGSVLAMGLPIGVAVAGVGLGAALISLVSNVLSVPDFATTLGAMIGLGVGIDYALFIVTRYREGLDAGHTPAEATAAAIDTAGRAVIFAGLTVVISLLGMLLMGLSFITGLAIGAALTVAVTMVASVTLLPALLGFVGTRIEVTRWYALVAAALISLAFLGAGLGIPLLLLGIPVAIFVFVVGRWLPALRLQVPRRPKQPIRNTLAYRWSRAIQAHPWIAIFAGAAFLLALAAPVLTLRMGFSDEGNYSEDTTTRRAYDLLADGFGPGFNGPLLVTAEVHDPADRDALDGLLAALAADPGIASVGTLVPSNADNPQSSDAYLVQIVPTTAPQDEATSDLVQRLRKDVVPSAIDGTSLAVNITGTVAVNIDFTDYLARRIVIFFGAVLGLSFLLLMTVFRSVLVPVKAVVMNVLSIGAAYGLVVAIFQWGWGGPLLGIEEAPIEPFIPMMMFAIVFGLSMDYEVFLLSRVREEFDRTSDAFSSVADGLAATARVISAAAAIMVVVFGSFVLEDARVIKLFGLGLAAAVLLDATVVRLLLVPATMELLGDRNWWFPNWLDRLLPRVHVEGTPAVQPVAVVDD